MHDDLRKSEKDSTLEHSLVLYIMRSDGGVVAAAGRGVNSGHCS